MRISTNTLYQNGIARISSMQAEQSKLQQQISSGLRILTPSDDPVAAARALELKEALTSNSQYAVVRSATLMRLSISSRKKVSQSHSEEPRSTMAAPAHRGGKSCSMNPSKLMVENCSARSERMRPKKPIDTMACSASAW